MPAQPKYPIDDNTLFILLALRYQGHIEIDGLDSVYDWNVNYDETVITQDCGAQDNLNYGELGLAWICKAFNIKPKRCGKRITLKIENEKPLEKFLTNYLSAFTQYKHYYYSEDKHKKRLYDFIKSKNEEILEHDDKYFSDKFLPDVDKEKYKMIEYVGTLFHSGILCSANEPFSFNKENNLFKKVIRLKFPSKIIAGEFFLNYLEAEKRIEVLEALKKERPICESNKFKLYDNKVDNVLYKERSYHLKPALFKLIEFCVKNKKKEITIKDYKENINAHIEDASVEKYFSEFNDKLATKIFCSIGLKKWSVDI